MNVRTYIIIFSLLFCLPACQYKTEDSRSEITTSNLYVDHLNIWVKNPKLAKERLTNIGFTAVPDTLSAMHIGQGTAGRYFHFLNGYLELIFVHDQNELINNSIINKDLDFTERANNENNGASPYSIALQVKDYDITKIPFATIPYHQAWMTENMNIYSAKNSKTHLQEPSIFVVYPEIAADHFETVADLKNIPDEYAFVRNFYKHPNGAKKITNMVITSTDIDLKAETMTAVNSIENVTIQNGKTHVMELTFDNHRQGKSFDLRPDLPLIINM